MPMGGWNLIVRTPFRGWIPGIKPVNGVYVNLSYTHFSNSTIELLKIHIELLKIH